MSGKIEKILECMGNYALGEHHEDAKPMFDDIAAARSELLRLRDAELMARFQLACTSGKRRGIIEQEAWDPDGRTTEWNVVAGDISVTCLPDDGTGLPLLTPEARAALEAQP